MSVIHTEYSAEETTLKIAFLRSSTAFVIAQIQELEKFVKPTIQARYQVSIGPSELTHLELQYTLAGIKRQLVLGQGYRNPWAVDWKSIKQQVSEELTGWEDRLSRKRAEIHTAQKYLNEHQSAFDDPELKTLFREIIQIIHPDLNSIQSEQTRQLWPQAQAAYQRADLGALQTLMETLSTTTEEPPPTSDSLRCDQYNELRAHSQRLKDKLDELQRDPVFVLRSQLSDPTWIRRRCQDNEFLCRGLSSEIKDLSLAISFIPITFPPWPIDSHGSSPHS